MSLKTRRRGTELEAAILDAAWEILVERGYSGFTYEAIAALAGTSRPVLYRHYPQREDLLLAAVKKHWWSQPIPVPDTGSLREDAIGYLTNAVDGRWRVMTFIGVQLMEYFRETGTSFADLRDKLRPPGQVSGFETMVARAVERGELTAATRSPRVVNLPFDLLRHDLFMTMRQVSPESIAEIVDAVWLPLLGARP
ncbi:TetR/AcrR family transcriptional regulator [Dactylosporangium vinaceum]|uniref:TetR/AcrR family transcriptional regulator n=1 Tax=Dactylosporangium vinaceum TaxID=53362 RepID=A0ABV5MEC6_9ACTN|nr:TetR/AcrR family transcriptional regulator [Dactylosporangium vinaceum]UAB92439.1 TetR/AcrR family transcriptional regulator [Dactylosporangium vinaceum]